jgi:hypothetical protein
LFSALLLSGCTADPPLARLQDYEERLFRTLDIDFKDTRSPAPARFPSQPTLLKDSPRETIDILDLWSARECALHAVVAQRNSSLGRVAQPSTRLFYELEFLRLAPACIELLQQQGKAELAATLGDALAGKETALPRVIWQGILGGGEYEQYWKLPQRLGDYPDATYHAADEALKALAGDVRRWLGADYRFDSAQVEANLQALLSGDAGAVYKSAVLQSLYLERIDKALVERQDAGTICRSGQDPKASILDTVVRKYFISTIQPWSVRVQARAYQIEAARDIEALLADAEPQEFGVWRQQRDEMIAAGMSAPRSHVESLLPIMRECGLAPQQQVML